MGLCLCRHQQTEHGSWNLRGDGAFIDDRMSVMTQINPSHIAEILGGMPTQTQCYAAAYVQCWVLTLTSFLLAFALQRPGCFDPRCGAPVQLLRVCVGGELHAVLALHACDGNDRWFKGEIRSVIWGRNKQCDLGEK